MPLVYTESIWYSLYNEPGVVGTSYKNYRSQVMYGQRRGWIRNAGAQGNHHILVIGPALGFLMEQLIDDGIPNVWGIDPSPWVWANTDLIRPDVLPRIANDWVGSGTEAASLAAIGAPATFRYIIDEDVASSHSDAELPAFLSSCEALLTGGAHGRIIHIVTPVQADGRPGDTGLNWKYPTEWKALAPAHTWYDTRAKEVIP